jgi:hypothetical protein
MLHGRIDKQRTGKRARCEVWSASTAPVLVLVLGPILRSFSCYFFKYFSIVRKILKFSYERVNESTRLRAEERTAFKQGAAVLKLHRTAEFHRTRRKNTGLISHLSANFAESYTFKMPQLDQFG